MPAPKTEIEWQERTRAYLKGKLMDSNITYVGLVARIRKLGFDETEASITNKLARGTFSATFFLAALTAIGCDTIKIKEI
jgi:hypothetical protein